MGNEVRVRATVDDKVSGPLDRIKDKFEVLGKKGAGASLLGNLGAMGVAKGLSLVEEGLGAVVDQVFQSIEAASSLRESMALTDQVFGENSKEMDAWASGAAEAFGESKRAALDYASNFGNVLSASGLAMDDVAEKSRELTERAADLGSAFNQSGEDVATALRSGLVGEAEPLRRFGILLSATAVEAEAYGSGIAKAGAKLTEAQKVQARFNIIMKQSSASAGMFGRDSESLADAQKMLQATLEDTQAAIGEELLPVMVDLANFAREDLVPAVREFVDLMKEAAPMMEAAADAFFELGPSDDNIDRIVDLNNELAAMRERLGVIPEATEEPMAELSNFAGKAKDDSLTIAESFDDVGASATHMSDELRDAVDRMKTAYDDLRNSLIDDTNEVVRTAFEVYNDEVELTAVMAEKSALRQAIAAGTATREQKARYEELVQRQTELVGELAENGRENTEIVSTAVADMRKDLTHSQAPVRRAINATITLIDELRNNIRLAAIDLRNFRAEVASTVGASGSWRIDVPGRAAGGPIEAGAPYIVGEQGPELIVPATDATVIPNGEWAAPQGGSGMALTGGGGGNVYQLFVNVDAPGVLTPAQGQALAREVGPFLMDYIQRRG
jgi:hypothetical protein